MTASLCTEDVKPIVDQLCSEFPTNLSEVDPGRILYVRKNGKKSPTSLKAVANPWDLCTKYKFVLTIHGPKFDSLSDDKKAIAIFDELLRIKDFESSSLVGHTVVGNRETLETWGLDWLEAEDQDIAPVFKRKSGQKEA